MRWIRSITGPSLTSALSAAPGVDAWPLLPWTVIAKAEHRFSPTPTVVGDPAAVLDPLAAALVQDVVGAHEVGVRLDEP